jgi:hypothetical protein
VRSAGTRAALHLGGLGLAFAAWLSYDESHDPFDIPSFEDAYRCEWDSLRGYAEEWAESMGLFDMADKIGSPYVVVDIGMWSVTSTSRCIPSRPNPASTSLIPRPDMPDPADGLWSRMGLPSRRTVVGSGTDIHPPDGTALQRLRATCQLLGLIARRPEEHAGESEPRYVARAGGPIAVAPGRPSISRFSQATPGPAANCGSCLPSHEGRCVHRWLLLAHVPRARALPNVESGLLAAQARRQCEAGCGNGPTAWRCGLASPAILGA